MRVSIAICLSLLGLTLLVPGRAADPEKLFKQGRQAERQGRDLDAYLLYLEARAAEPGEAKYVLAAEAVRPRAAQTIAALGDYGAALALDPSNAYLLAEAQPKAAEDPVTAVDPVDPRDGRSLKPPVDLQPQDKLARFSLKGGAQTVYEQVAREFGLEVLFDPDFDSQKEVRFQLDECDFRRAILALNDVAQAFVVPVNSKLFLVAADTGQKRAELEPMIVVIEPIPHTMNPEEANQLGQAVQQALEMKRLTVDTVRSRVVMRDTVTKVRLAQALYRHLSKPRAEVIVDVELFAITAGGQRNLGIDLPAEFPLQYLGAAFNSQPAAPDGSTPLIGIGGGDSLFGLAVGSARVVATELKSSGRLLTSFRVRSASGLPAKLHIGDRYPIINASFSPIVFTGEIQDSIDEGSFRQPFPSFTFEDLGVIFNVTPYVHSAREVSLEIEAQFRLLSGQSVNDIPVIANREFKSFVRLTEGQVALVSGMAVYERQQTHSGLSGLADLPFLGKIFRSRFQRYTRADLLLTMKPRLISLPAAEIDPSVTLMFGPESRPVPAL